jgi:diguanylate cyclase (GGDEF)-like protein
MTFSEEKTKPTSNIQDTMADNSARTVIKVLLVEDNPGDARLIRQMLAEASATVFDLNHVEELRDAFKCLKEEDYDVVMVDLSLPNVRGTKTVDEIQSEFPKVPIVVLSGLSDEALAVKAVEGGAQDYVVKGQGDGNLVSRSLRYAIERKRVEEHLAFLAHYDHLTGLANRALFRDRLNQSLARADRNKNQVALMFLDLDNFKAVNDTLGHDAGDLLLQGVSERIRRCVRKTDTVARLGGDEFTVILEGITSMQQPAMVAQKILDSLLMPFNLSGHEVFITTSIGITIYPSDSETIKDLLKYADRAMYRAKEQGCNHYQFYAAEMNIRATERLTFRSSLHYALDREELLLHYQPQINLISGEVVGVEALLRWDLPQYGLLYPERFITLAEETELIAPIGEWVLRTACKQSRQWINEDLSPFRISVNISSRQFRRRELAGKVEKILKETDMDPQRLELELTEGTLMENTEASSDTLELLKNMGVRISIDDFGTGYSSLGYLQRFPIDTLKIARTFVKDITTNPDDAAIARAIIALAQSLRLEVIAEGIETTEQLELLRTQGCEIAQGFLLSRPLPADSIPALVSNGNKLTQYSGLLKHGFKKTA